MVMLIQNNFLHFSLQLQNCPSAQNKISTTSVYRGKYVFAIKWKHFHTLLEIIKKTIWAVLEIIVNKMRCFSLAQDNIPYKEE